MRLLRFEHNNQIFSGRLERDGSAVEVLQDIDAHDPMIALLEQTLAGVAPSSRNEFLPLEAVRLLAPIHRPSKNVLCVGKNYVAHAREFNNSGYDSGATAAAVPEAPIIFSKAPCCLSGAADDIEVPWTITQKVDYEAELGVIIGKPGRAIAAADAYNHVWGYTVINDVTARDLQAQHKQWLLGKSIDSFCPIGPWLTSADEVDAENLELTCYVNGELRQQANTRDLIFDIPAIIACVSASMSLATGDIIATGTPAGVGIGFDPPRFLQSGDRVTIEIGGLGQISNVVV